MPVPTTHPQRARSASVGAMPASRIACSAAASAKRCERLANFEQLAVRRHAAAGRHRALRRRCASRSPLASNVRDRSAAAAALEQPCPHRRHVVAGGRDHAHAGDRHSSFHRSHLEMHARAADRPALTFGARFQHAQRHASCATSSTVARNSSRGARLGERAQLDVGHAAKHRPRPACGLRHHAARKRRHAVEQQRSRKHRAPRKMIVEERRFDRHVELRASRTVRVSCSSGVSGTGAIPRNRSACAPWLHSVVKNARIATGSSNSVERQHRPDAIVKLEHRRAADARPALVGDRIVLAGVDVDLGFQRVAWAWVRRGTRSRARCLRPAASGTRASQPRPTRRAGRSLPRAATTGKPSMPVGMWNVPCAETPGTSAVIRSTNVNAA